MPLSKKNNDSSASINREPKHARFAISDEIGEHQQSTISCNSVLSYESSGLESDEDRSSVHMDDEALPNIEYYAGTMSVKRVVSRPTMQQLHHAAAEGQTPLDQPCPPYDTQAVSIVLVISLVHP